MNRKVMVTGANGFVGRRLAQTLLAHTYRVNAPLRSMDCASNDNGMSYYAIAGIDGQTDWTAPLKGVDSVVHLAARVHIMHSGANSDANLAEYRRVNVEGTLNLARQAAVARVRRFVFISSIKVNGEETADGGPYLADGIPSPMDPYGISKYEAECGLRRLSKEAGFELVIIRPVMVYGPSVGANFLSMMRWLYWGLPLPFGAIKNRRSFVAIDNLVSLILVCLHHDRAVDNVFLVSDGGAYSTPELLRLTAKAMDVSARLISVPEPVLHFASQMLGISHVAKRLCGSLEVDIEKTKSLLEWTPPVSMNQALAETAQHFLAALRR